jgi:hypothetical protein
MSVAAEVAVPWSSVRMMAHMSKPYRISLLATALFLSGSGVRFGAAPESVAFTHVAVVDPGGTGTERQ